MKYIIINESYSALLFGVRGSEQFDWLEFHSPLCSYTTRALSPTYHNIKNRRKQKKKLLERIFVQERRHFVFSYFHNIYYMRVCLTLSLSRPRTQSSGSRGVLVVDRRLYLNIFKFLKNENEKLHSHRSPIMKMMKCQNNTNNTKFRICDTVFIHFYISCKNCKNYNTHIPSSLTYTHIDI